jgi:hypothetical protein
MPKPRTRRSATGAEDTADSPAVVETTVFRSGNSDAERRAAALFDTPPPEGSRAGG